MRYERWDSMGYERIVEDGIIRGRDRMGWDQI